jgi:fibrillarin-like rRNA methylase
MGGPTGLTRNERARRSVAAVEPFCFETTQFACGFKSEAIIAAATVEARHWSAKRSSIGAAFVEETRYF